MCSSDPIYNAKSLTDSTRQNEQRLNLEEHILTSKVGVVMTDIAGEFTPVNMQSPIISAATLKFMKSGIIRCLLAPVKIFIVYTRITSARL